MVQWFYKCDSNSSDCELALTMVNGRLEPLIHRLFRCLDDHVENRLKGGDGYRPLLIF